MGTFIPVIFVLDKPSNLPVEISPEKEGKKEKILNILTPCCHKDLDNLCCTWYTGKFYLKSNPFGVITSEHYLTSVAYNLKKIKNVLHPNI